MESYTSPRPPLEDEDLATRPHRRTSRSLSCEGYPASSDRVVVNEEQLRRRAFPPRPRSKISGGGSISSRVHHCQETMEKSRLVLLVFLVIVHVAAAQQCSTSIGFRNQFRKFATCVDLREQGAKLAWTYMPSNNTLSVAFSGTASSSSGWVGWGINLGSKASMIGTNALVAFEASNGTTLLDYKLTAATQGGQLPSCSKIDLVVLDRDVAIDGTDVNLYAVIQLQPNQTRINHVWNRGPGVTDFKLQAHPQNTNDLTGRGSIDVSTGTVATAGPLHQKLKDAHGFINAVGWGILLPLGAMSARYVRTVHDRAWFYLHVFFQATGYLLGLSGWAIGLKLGSYSKGVVHHSHRNLGIALFVLATLQAIGGLLRPKPDHKYRRYFNLVHHTLGYLIIILSVINIFKGLDILAPKHKWRRAYIAILVLLACISFVLEIIKWIQYVRKRRAAHRLPQKPVFDGQVSDA